MPISMDHYMAEWLCYNCVESAILRGWVTLGHCATASFHTKKVCNRLYSTEIEFYFLKQKNRF